MLSNYVVLDLEMTGLSAKRDQIIEIGAIKVVDGEQRETYSCVVNSHCRVPQSVVELTKITNEMVQNGIEKDQAIAELLDFMEGYPLVGHNLGFDYGFLKQWAINHKRPLSASACDTLKIARALLPVEQSKKLEDLCQYFQIERVHGHRALYDAMETKAVFCCLVELAKEKGGCDELFVPKPLVYQAKKQTPATAHQIQRLVEYRQKHQITASIEWENLTRNEASRIMDKYILRYGR